MEHTSPIFKYMHFVKLNDLRELSILKQMYLYANGLTPEPIAELFVRNWDKHGYETRQRSDPRLMKLKYAMSRASFHCSRPKLLIHATVKCPMF